MLNPPDSEHALLERACSLSGSSLRALSAQTGIPLPLSATNGKGWIGMALEHALGSTAGSNAEPDFPALGIELKTIPLKAFCKPAESTYVTTLPLKTLSGETWKTSVCHAKLKRVLWVPVEGLREIPFAERRIGEAFLWSPSAEEESVLANDWLELTSMATMGRLEEIHAGIGVYLQVRPKAANNQALSTGYDSEGNPVRTLPRGFYLRPSFTAQILRHRFQQGQVVL